jgi:hypothetical protein
MPSETKADALGLTALGCNLLVDPRAGKNGRHTLLAQFRQAVLGRLAGYEDVNDADRARSRDALGGAGRAVTDHRVHETDGRHPRASTGPAPEARARAELGWSGMLRVRAPS